MNPDFPRNPRDELEASLTALILGELPADQAFTLGRAIERDAELSKLYERLKRTIELVRQTAASPTEELHRLTGWAIQHHVTLSGLTVDRPSLEDVYLRLTRDGTPSGGAERSPR